MLSLLQAESVEQFEQVRRLWREYAAWLEVDLCFQNFEKELAELPGRYAPPEGRLLLAFSDDRLAGCIALRKIGEGACEMKRLYVRPGFRGQGIGRLLTEALIKEARGIGYARMLLDTLPSKMKEAAIVYRSFGFREIEPYYHNPVAGAVYMELTL
ncbi:MAG TPA: GNAT family N-acetyltransferase [Pyrinomonadaceae bacterium]|jgi:ribosomal protein S18 acetylase RimI-like enzyme